MNQYYTKDIKDIYIENDRSLEKEYVEDFKNGKISLCFWIGRTNLI